MKSFRVVSAAAVLLTVTFLAAGPLTAARKDIPPGHCRQNPSLPGCSTTTTAAATTTTAAATTSAATTTTVDQVGGFGPAVTVKGIFGRDSSSDGLSNIVAAGFDTVSVPADRGALDTLAAKGLKGFVWLGEYHRTKACSFEFSDALVTSLVSAIAGHPAIAAYMVADEPSYARTQGCPAVADIASRADLISSLDPSKPTFVTLTTWDGAESYPFQYWPGSADIFGLVVYPCYQGICQFDIIDTAIGEAAADGLGEYWPVTQDFEDSWYDMPTAAQLDEQFSRWAPSPMSGYLMFAGRGFACCTPSDYETNPAKRAVYQQWNGS